MYISISAMFMKCYQSREGWHGICYPFQPPGEVERVGIDSGGETTAHIEARSTRAQTEQKEGPWETNLADGKAQTQPHQTATF